MPPLSELYAAALVDRRPPEHEAVPALIAWARRLAEAGMTPSYGAGDHGNLSVRTRRGCLVSARESRKAALAPSDVVEIIQWEEVQEQGVLQCRGLRFPSSDAYVHLAIYRRRGDVQAIVHGHDDALLAQGEALGVVMTHHTPDDLPHRLFDELCELATGHEALLVRQHGAMVLGRSLEEAGERLLDLQHRARMLSGDSSRI